MDFGLDVGRRAAARLDISAYEVQTIADEVAGEAVASAFFARSEEAREDNVNATPTFVVRGPRGERLVEGAANLSQFQEAVGAVGPQG